MQFPIQHAALVSPGQAPGGVAPRPSHRAAGSEATHARSERAKFPPEAVRQNRRRRIASVEAATNWTVGWYFDGLGYEVMYRETPQGPEVLAVGPEEVIRLRQAGALRASAKDLKPTWGIIAMSRLIVPISFQDSWATGDELLWLEFVLWLQDGAGNYVDHDFYVDSGADDHDLSRLRRPATRPGRACKARDVQFIQTGLRSAPGCCVFASTGWTRPNTPSRAFSSAIRPSGLSPNAPIGTVPRKLLQPLALLEKLRFTMEKDPTGRDTLTTANWWWRRCRYGDRPHAHRQSRPRPLRQAAHRPVLHRRRRSELAGRRRSACWTCSAGRKAERAASWKKTWPTPSATRADSSSIAGWRSCWRTAANSRSSPASRRSSCARRSSARPTEATSRRRSTAANENRLARSIVVRSRCRPAARGRSNGDDRRSRSTRDCSPTSKVNSG